MNGIYVKVIALIIRDLRSQLEARDKTISAVLALHRPVTICPEADDDDWGDPCPCGDPDQHYQVCEVCCMDGPGTSETCATCHTHGGYICATVALLHPKATP